MAAGQCCRVDHHAQADRAVVSGLCTRRGQQLAHALRRRLVRTHLLQLRPHYRQLRLQPHQHSYYHTVTLSLCCTGVNARANRARPFSGWYCRWMSTCCSRYLAWKSAATARALAVRLISTAEVARTSAADPPPTHKPLLCHLPLLCDSATCGRSRKDPKFSFWQRFMWK